MATITASTKHVVKTTSAAPSMKTATANPAKKMGGPKGGATNGSAASRRTAPPLKPSNTVADIVKEISLLPETNGTDDTIKTKITTIQEVFRRVLGEHTTLQLNKPHAASTTRDRGIAAADLALITKEVGISYVMNQCGILNDIQRMLFPDGIESLVTRGGGSDEVPTTLTADTNFNDGGNSNDGMLTPGLSSAGNTAKAIKPSTSALSLTSLLDDATLTSFGGFGGGDTTDSINRGKTTPPNAREGCLLYIRALIECIGKMAEPYVVGAFLAAALDECASSNSAVREAAEDTSTAIISIASPYAYRPVIGPILLQSLRCMEWRTKAAALDRLAQCAATTASRQVYNDIPILIPALTNQVWDTKAQVSKAARTALLAICNTNTNADIRPTIPALVNAICKPSDTNKAMGDLMGTTFVVPVDASVLAILCPLLARALKEKLAIHKRAACIVINNMSKLVSSPAAIAPFGSLLVPELQRVIQNVQFTEIQQEATKALTSLTKALGDQYNTAKDTSDTPPVDTIMTTSSK